MAKHMEPGGFATCMPPVAQGSYSHAVPLGSSRSEVT